VPIWKFLVGDKPEDQGDQNNLSHKKNSNGLSLGKCFNCFTQISAFLAISTFKSDGFQAFSSDIFYTCDKDTPHPSLDPPMSITLTR